MIEEWTGRWLAQIEARARDELGTAQRERELRQDVRDLRRALRNDARFNEVVRRPRHQTGRCRQEMLGGVLGGDLYGPAQPNRARVFESDGAEVGLVLTSFGQSGTIGTPSDTKDHYHAVIIDDSSQQRVDSWEEVQRSWTFTRKDPFEVEDTGIVRLQD
jgi:hypothetical protein